MITVKWFLVCIGLGNNSLKPWHILVFYRYFNMYDHSDSENKPELLEQSHLRAGFHVFCDSNYIVL